MGKKNKIKLVVSTNRRPITSKILSSGDSARKCTRVKINDDCHGPEAMLFRGLWSVFPRARVYLIVCINMISPRSSDPKPEQCPWMYSLLSPGDRDRVLRVCTSRNDRVTLCSAVVSFRFFRENTFNYGRARNASFVPRRTACGLTVSYIRYKIYHARIHIIIIIIIHA